MRLGTQELLIILAIALLLFGPKNLPRLGKAMGQTLGNFRSGVKKGQVDMEKDESCPEEA